jgi:5-methylcytosine-specific restriction endonuclease McrA
MMKLPSNVTSHEWEMVRRRVIAAAHACAICGRPLDPYAPPRSRWSTSVDHRIPRALFRNADPRTQRLLCLDVDNLQAVHARCNSRKGKRRQAQVVPRPQSQEW